MRQLQALEYQQYTLKQAVLADVALYSVQNRGCWPMRGAHWYTSP